MSEKNILLAIIFSVFYLGLSAQGGDFKTIVSQGVFNYEKGDYEEALSFFKQAYRINRKSDYVCYELALTYLALNENENAAIYSGKIIDKGKEYIEDAYLINASAWENLGRTKRAQKIYTKGIKALSGSYLLHYNLALSLYNDKKYDKAQEHAITAVELEHGHGSSHLLLAYIMFDKGERVKSMLPLYYFLFIEQDSDRSATAYELLTTLWNQGVTHQGQKEIRLINAGFEYSEFGAVELALSMIKPLDGTEKHVDSSKNPGLIRFADNNKVLFKVLAESAEGKQGFWWDFYVNFFSKIDQNNLSEPFSYFISSCKYNKDVLIWLSENHKEYKRFSEWIELL